MVALTVTTPDVVVFKMLPPEIEPPAVLGVTTLHVMVLLVALLGTTVPVSVSGRVAVAVVDTLVMLVTGTKSSVTSISATTSAELAETIAALVIITR